MGLPNSSVSQCRRVEVFTWRASKEVYSCYIDIDEIAGGRMPIVPEPRRISVPAEYRDLMAGLSGTVVVWKNCDRLDFCGREETLTRELPRSLGQAYRYYLARGKTIKVNGREVKPFDPLFLMPEAEFSGAVQHGAPLRFDFDVPGDGEMKGLVEVKFSLLPEEWQATGKRKESRDRGIDRSRGFSIVRAGREIDFGYFRMRSPHWTDSWWSCEISFDPVLDELFGVTHTKQEVKLSERVKTRIEKDINANIATLNDIIVARGNKRHSVNARKAEDIAKDSEKFLRSSPAIRDKPTDVAETELREYAEEKAPKDKTVDELIREIRERPFLMDFENLPGAPFYRVRTFGKTTVVTLNRDHAFYEKLYAPLCDRSPASKTAVELLLFALAKSETLASEDATTWYRTQRHEWSRVLSVYLDGLQSLDELLGQ